MAEDGDGFGGLEPVLLAQEEKLAAFAEENRVLGAAVETLQTKLKAAEGRAAAATKRASEAEARLHARSAAESGVAQQLADKQQEAERLRHRLSNETLLREQAERGRRDGEQQAAAAQRQAAALRDENADLSERLAVAQRQVLQLESLQPFADSWGEQKQRERELAAALEAANSRAAGLEARCMALERELGDTAAALAAAQQLADSVQQQLADSRARQQQQQLQQQHGGRRSPERRQRRADSLTLSDLADLGGAESALPGSCASPQRSSGAMPSREWALQRRQATAAAATAQQQAAEAEAAADAEADANAAQLSLVADLQRQLLQQHRQLAALLDAPPSSEGGGRAAALEAQLEKLKRRNTHLQMALAEASLQHARAAGAAQKQLQDALQDAAQLRQQRDAAAEQLSQLQAAAAALGVGGDGSGAAAACSAERLEQLHGELIEYASRCNEAVEQNAVLQAEKRAWLERLRACEAESQRLRAEAGALRLGKLGAVGMGGSAGFGGGGGPDAEQALLEQVLEAQASEAALRSLLDEAREQQVAAAKALSSELRRVHALERLRISDVAEVQRLQRRVHELQVDCQQLGKALAAAQQQLAGSATKRRGGVGAGGGSHDFRIPAAYGFSGAS